MQKSPIIRVWPGPKYICGTIFPPLQYLKQITKLERLKNNWANNLKKKKKFAYIRVDISIDSIFRVFRV